MLLFGIEDLIEVDIVEAGRDFESHLKTLSFLIRCILHVFLGNARLLIRARVMHAPDIDHEHLVAIGDAIEHGVHQRLTYKHLPALETAVLKPLLRSSGGRKREGKFSSRSCAPAIPFRQCGVILSRDFQRENSQGSKSQKRWKTRRAAKTVEFRWQFRNSYS